MAAQQPSKYADFEQRVIRLGDVAPDFEADSSAGRIKLYDFLGDSWGVLFSHPRDFTPVCTSELGRVAQLKKAFAERNTKVLALSVDTTANHGTWIKDINEIVGCSVDFPIVADPDRRISCLYGMLNQEHLEDSGLPFTVRSVFVIGPDRKVKLLISYPASTGRNFDEILRVIDSLQLTLNHKVATPADWTKGKVTSMPAMRTWECVVLPTISTDDAKKIFPKGVTEVRPWLRTTPDPTA